MFRNKDVGCRQQGGSSIFLFHPGRNWCSQELRGWYSQTAQHKPSTWFCSKQGEYRGEYNKVDRKGQGQCEATKAGCAMGMPSYLQRQPCQPQGAKLRWGPCLLLGAEGRGLMVAQRTLGLGNPLRGLHRRVTKTGCLSCKGCKPSVILLPASRFTAFLEPTNPLVPQVGCLHTRVLLTGFL